MTVFACPSEYGSGALWTIGMLCPRCGGGMNVENQGRTYPRESCAIVRCIKCKAPQTLLVRLLEMGHEPGIEGEGKVHEALCGTDSGYNRHRVLNEPTCHRCREAHARAAQDRGK